jgi:hypothetical protein
MNWLIVVSHAVAKRLSYYHAGWDYPESASRDRERERECVAVWRACEAALKNAGVYDEFRKAGRYLI